MDEHSQNIRTQFAALRQQGQRHRDIAQTLGLCEGALVAAHMHAPPDAALQATALAPLWPQLVAALEPLGQVMALTRNAGCVHECVGVYRVSSQSSQGGRVQGGGIDLRLRYAPWAWAFAVREAAARGEQRSLQIFDAGGMALHKVFLQPRSDWTPLLARFALAPEQSVCAFCNAEGPSPADSARNVLVDVQGLRRAWMDVRSAQAFEALLHTWGLTRLQALQWADPQFVQAVSAADVQDLLHAGAREGLPLAVCVQNPGVTQSYLGAIGRVSVMGPWLNVLDPGFKLHLHQDHIGSAWVVRKPTAWGLCTSLELFDPTGQPLLTLSAVRQPGQPEPCAWSAWLNQLMQEEEQPCTP